MKISELIKPTERQRECLKAIRQFRFVLYGGAMGGGKSYILRWWCVLQCIYYFVRYGVRNVRVGLFSEDYPTLVDRQISKIKFEFPEWLGKIVESRTEGFNFKLADKFGAGTIAFRNLDDPSKYNSAEFASIAVEELTKNKEEVFHELRKRMRWPGIPDSDTRFLGATNPGGPGHAWVKKFWVDGELPPEMTSIAGQFHYVKSLAQDNPHLSPAYYDSLLTLPSEMRRAYAEGDWDLFEGQFFQEWRREIHVCKAFPIPDYWRRFRAIDWGWSAPTAGVWFAVSPDNRLYIYRELYKTQTIPSEIARMVLELSAGESSDYTVLDTKCWWTDDGSIPIAEQMQSAGLICSKATKDRFNGWVRVRQYLDWKRDDSGKLVKEPLLKVFENCTNTIRTIPSQVYDKHRPEDLDTDGEDHLADAIRYGLMSRTAPTIIPEHQLAPDYKQALERLNHYENAQ